MMKAKIYAGPAIAFGLALGLAALSASGELAGERRLEVVYEGRVKDTQTCRENACRISIEIDRVTFLLSSIQNKYRIVRVKVENGGKEPIQLSADEDTIELGVSDGSAIRGFLDLSRRDARLWNSLDLETKKALAYPKLIRGRRDGESGPGARPTVVYLFAFFPGQSVTKLPDSFTYGIRSLDEPVQIAVHAPAAR